MTELFIDIETYASVNLSRSGVYPYAESPDFQILLISYSVSGAPVRLVDLAGGEPLPEEFLSMLQDASVLKWAYNAGFERVCLSRLLRDRGLLPPGAFLSPESWRCSMVLAATLGLPVPLRCRRGPEPAAAEAEGGQSPDPLLLPAGAAPAPERRLRPQPAFRGSGGVGALSGLQHPGRGNGAGDP